MKTLVAFALAVSILLVANVASARSITVNGRLLDAAQIAVLDQVACTRVPDGRYWVLPNGAWGYEGVPVLAGFIGALCIAPPVAAAPAPEHRPSLSERGLLYYPGEIISR